MKKLIFLIVLLLSLFASTSDGALTYGPSYYLRSIRYVNSGSPTIDPLYLFMNEMDTLPYFTSGIKIMESNGATYYTTIACGNQSGNLTLTLPTGAGTNGQVLSTNGSGTLSWATAGSGTFTGGAISSDITLADDVDILPTTVITDTWSIQVYDTDAPGYLDVLRWTNATTPTVVFGNAAETLSIVSTRFNVSTVGAVSGVAALTQSGGIASINASSDYATNINTGTSAGAVTIGGGSGTVAINSSVWDITTAGAVTGLTSLSFSDDISLANGKALKGSAVSGETVAFQVYDNDTGPAYKNAILLTNGNTPTVVIGDNNPTVAVNSSDWDIGTTGIMTGIGAITSDGLLTCTGGETMTGTVSINDSSTGTTSLGSGTGSGAVSIGTGATIQTIDVGTGGAAKTVTLGSTNSTSTTAIKSGSNGVNINVSNAAQPTNINSGDSTGIVTVGGTGIMAINIGAGGTGAKTIAIGDGASTGTTTIKAGSGKVIINATNGTVSTDIGTGNTSGTVTIGNAAATITEVGTYTVNNNASTCTTGIGTGTTSGAITIGGNSNTLVINTSDWDIDATGIMTNIGAITSNGLFTGTLGATISGAAVSLNADSNFGVNLCTGSSNGTVTIGGDSGLVVVDSSDWNINATGDMTGIGAITSNGLWTGTLGATVTGATTSINASSNFATNINTGTSTGTATIGNALATVVVSGAVVSVNTDAGTCVTNLGTGTTSGAVTVGGTGTQTIDIGTGAGVKTVNIGSTNTTSTTTIAAGSGLVNFSDVSIANVGDIACDDITSDADSDVVISAVKMVVKTLDVNSADTTGSDFRFDNSQANMTEQCKDLGAIIPAFAEVLSCQIRCTETVTGSATMGIDIGTTTGANDILTTANIDSANDLKSATAAGSPLITSTAAARHVWVNATPDANWNTPLVQGRWVVIVAYLDFGAAYTQCP